MDIVGLLRDSEFSAANNRFKAADEIERLRAAVSVADAFLGNLQQVNSEPLNSINGGDRKTRAHFTAELRNDARLAWANVGNLVNGHIDVAPKEPD